MSAPLLVAHRGAPRRGTGENTVRAFREAVESGADGVEMDVRLTKDGRLAVFHDADAEVRGKRIAVRSLAYEDLRDPAVEVHDRVPTLEEAILVGMKSWFPITSDATKNDYSHFEDAAFTYRKIIWRWEDGGIETEDDWKAG